MSETAKNGFSFLLTFVTATIVCSIVAVKTFGVTLADCDWLHADAEQLLTLTNVVVVIGLKSTFDAFSTGIAPKPPPVPIVPLVVGFAVAAIGFTYAAAGGVLDAHTPYLGGYGDLPEGLWTFGFAEPVNALTIPTWVVHFSSLLEWLVAMGLIWRIGIVTGNGKWKGMTWAMIPSHTSGICACTYHFFYNAESVQYVVLLQAFFTLVGNTTLAFAAWRLAASNGWTVGGAFENAKKSFQSTNDESPAVADVQPVVYEAPSAEAVEAAGTLPATTVPGIIFLSVLVSYVVKYGETLLPFTLDGNVAPYLAGVLILGGTSLNVWKWTERSREGAKFVGFL
jgi:hypothetical protein